MFLILLSITSSSFHNIANFLSSSKRWKQCNFYFRLACIQTGFYFLIYSNLVCHFFQYRVFRFKKYLKVQRNLFCCNWNLFGFNSDFSQDLNRKVSTKLGSRKFQKIKHNTVQNCDSSPSWYICISVLVASEAPGALLLSAKNSSAYST